jgi:hypothetical protein
MMLLGPIVAMAGCNNISGRWESSAQPETTSSFALARATFNGDGTYEATGSYGGQERTSTGKYDFCWGKLTLTPDSGRGERSYKAHKCMFADGLKVTGDDDVQIVMKKVGCSSDCSKKCCSKCGAGCSKDCCKKKCAAGCTKPCCKTS